MGPVDEAKVKLVAAGLTIEMEDAFAMFDALLDAAEADTEEGLASPPMSGPAGLSAAPQ